MLESSRLLHSVNRQASTLVRPSIYVESSIVSYLASRPSRDVIVAARQAISHDWWSHRRHRFDLRISGLVEGAISSGSEEDALHIAIAAAQGADYLLTWNFRHINNAERKSAIAGVVESFGFACPQICSPEELGGDSDD